jgi:DNA-binding LacI/PurR family transcriptional regulator
MHSIATPPIIFGKELITMVTIYDLAKILNLNPSTVSRAFKHPEMLKEQTRKEILKTAEQIGYHPNMVASQLRTSDSNVIGVVMVDREGLWNWYSDTFIRGAQTEAAKHGYKVMAMDSNFSDYKSNAELFSMMRFAGIVVASTEILNLDCHFSSVIPMAFVNQGCCSGFNVLPDDYHDMHMELDYLRKQGHRKIAYLNGPEDSPHCGERFRAYCDVMKESGFGIRPEWVGSNRGWDSEAAYRETVRILGCKDRPTVITAAADSMCPGIYDAIHNLGLQIPRDISVAGYDNRELGELLYPHLTTVSFPLYEMGNRAILRLIELLDPKVDRAKLENPVHVRGKLIVRDSVRAVSA